MELPECRGPRSGSLAPPRPPDLKKQKEKGFLTAPLLPLRAAVICVAAFEIGVVTGSGAQSGVGASEGLMAAGVLG